MSLLSKLAAGALVLLAVGAVWRRSPGPESSQDEALVAALRVNAVSAGWPGPAGLDRVAFARAEALMETQRYEQALPLAEALAGRWPTSTRYQRLRQDCRRGLGQAEVVRSESRALLQAAPHQAWRWYLYSRLLDDPSAAARCCQRAIELDPRYPWGYYGLGSAWQRRGDPAQAARLLQQAIGLGLDYPYAYVRLAECRTRLGEREQALAAYGAFLSACPDDADRALVEHRASWLRRDYAAVAVLPLLGLLPTAFWLCWVRRRVPIEGRISWLKAALLVVGGALVAGPLLCQRLYRLPTPTGWLLDGLPPLAARITRHLLIVGPVEESSKWLVAVGLALALRLIRAPLEGIVCAVLVAMGFALAENLRYMWWEGVRPTATRLVTCVPVHMAVSSVWGYGLGRAITIAGTGRRMAVVCLSLAAAAGLHGGYNAAIELSRLNQAPGRPTWLGLSVPLALAALALLWRGLLHRAKGRGWSGRTLRRRSAAAHSADGAQAERPGVPAAGRGSRS